MKYLKVHLIVFIFLITLSFTYAQVYINGEKNAQIAVTTSHNSASDGLVTLKTASRLPNLTATSRFLGQATLGANIELIETTAEKGFNNWIEEQFALPIGLYLVNHVRFLTDEKGKQVIALGESEDKIFASDKFIHSAWWQHAMTAPDLLRSRIALALSEILVVSEFPTLQNEVLALASYYDLLLTHSFGNYRDLLLDVTLHPTMGTYLSHLNNSKGDLSINQFPDENYAREVMQLFSIGLYELNLDGTRKLENGEPIPTYDQTDIANFAKIFTGLTFSNAITFGRGKPERESYTSPMVMWNDYHEAGAKTLLNGLVVPDRNPVDGIADIEDAIDNLFNHDNVGPFLAYRLIQRLIKSNPTPEYVKRVATAFNDNGQGVRGDMKAVIKAILLDEEARDCAWIEEPTHGMLREPLVRHTQILRAFDAAAVSGLYTTSFRDYYQSTEQRAFSSPSVFNFFTPAHQPLGSISDAGLVAPEFQILNSFTSLAYDNHVNLNWRTNKRALQFNIIYRETSDDDDDVLFDLAEEMEMIGNDADIPTVLEKLNLLLMHGQMSASTRNIIYDAVTQISPGQTDMRLDMAIFLVMTSPEYLIMR